eukprot:jgi/Mesvir1/22941/Mv19451-RA.2
MSGMEHASATLRELKLYGNKLEQISDLKRLVNLQALFLNDNHISKIEGLDLNRSLTSLRLDGNALESTTGLERLTALKILDLSRNPISKLEGLTALTSLEEFSASGNALTSMEGLSKCTKLLEITLSHNQISKISQLKGLSKLDVLRLDFNKISSLSGLSEDMTYLTELYLANNQITSLEPITTRCPNLETLDVAYNKLETSEATIAPLKPLESLSEVKLTGNPYVESAGAGYRRGVVAELPQLLMLDDYEVTFEDRAPPQEAADDAFAPGVEEMEEFKRKMGIKSVPLDPAGRPILRPPSSGGRPGSSSGRPGSSSGRPGSAYSGGRPGTASGRPGTARAMAALGGGPGVDAPIKAPMMYQRPPSARTGGNSRLMTAVQFEESADAFKEKMDAYRWEMTAVLDALRENIRMPAAEAAAAIRANAAGATPKPLPQTPTMGTLQMPVRNKTASEPTPPGRGAGTAGGDPTGSPRGGAKAGAPAPGPKPTSAGSSRLSGSSSSNPGGFNSATSSSGGPSSSASSALANDPLAYLRDASEGKEALEMFNRLFPEAANPSEKPCDDSSSSYSVEDDEDYDTGEGRPGSRESEGGGGGSESAARRGVIKGPGGRHSAPTSASSSSGTPALSRSGSGKGAGVSAHAGMSASAGAGPPSRIPQRKLSVGSSQPGAIGGELAPLAATPGSPGGARRLPGMAGSRHNFEEERLRGGAGALAGSPRSLVGGLQLTSVPRASGGGAAGVSLVGAGGGGGGTPKASGSGANLLGGVGGATHSPRAAAAPDADLQMWDAGARVPEGGAKSGVGAGAPEEDGFGPDDREVAVESRRRAPLMQGKDGGASYKGFRAPAIKKPGPGANLGMFATGGGPGSVTTTAATKTVAVVKVRRLPSAKGRVMPSAAAEVGEDPSGQLPSQS